MMFDLNDYVRIWGVINKQSLVLTVRVFYEIYTFTYIS